MPASSSFSAFRQLVCWSSVWIFSIFLILTMLNVKPWWRGNTNHLPALAGCHSVPGSLTLNLQRLVGVQTEGREWARGGWWGWGQLSVKPLLSMIDQSVTTCNNQAPSIPGNLGDSTDSCPGLAPPWSRSPASPACTGPAWGTPDEQGEEGGSHDQGHLLLLLCCSLLCGCSMAGGEGGHTHQLSGHPRIGALVRKICGMTPGWFVFCPTPSLGVDFTFGW